MYVITDRSINDNGCATGMECHRGGNKALGMIILALRCFITSSEGVERS